MANKAEDLKAGDLFKRPRQTNWREVKEVIELGSGPNVPSKHKDCLLIITPDCGQIVFAKTDYVTIKSEQIAFEKLKDGIKVHIYIPTLKAFHKMEVSNYASGGFSISNYCLGKNHRIQGHDYIALVGSQEDLEKFFFIECGKITEESYIKANRHFSRNQLGWIFK